MFIQIDTPFTSNYADDGTPFTSNYTDDDTPFTSNYADDDTPFTSNYADDDTPFTSNYADDDTPFTSAQNHEKQVNSLKSPLNGVLEWYQENYFKTNADKCYLFLSPFSNKEVSIANYNIASSNSEEVLGAVIDSEVTFSKHIENLRLKTNQKLRALARVANFMILKKAPLSYENICCFFFNLIIVLLHGCVTVEN